MAKQAKPNPAKPHIATVRIPPDLWPFIEAHAERDQRSVNYLVIEALRARYQPQPMKRGRGKD